MKSEDVCTRIKEVGIIPAVRVSSSDDAHFAVEAVAQGGIPIVEITLTVPGAVELIAHLTQHHVKTLVGAGTVLDVETAKRCMDAGASFLTSPAYDPNVVEFGLKQKLTVLPGALSPTEVVNAWRNGCHFVKVFPCAQVGGEKYIRSLKTALPQIPLIAAGGVNQQTAAGFIVAGATAIGVGTELIPAESIARRQPKRIQELARRFLGFVKQGRDQLAAQAQAQAAAAHK